MSLVIEILIMLILVIILVTLRIDEEKKRKRASNLVKLKTYWDGVNRRRVMRYNATLDVHYRVNKNVTITLTRNISAHGIGLILHEKLPRRAVLTLEIKTDIKKDPIKAKALVVWSKEFIEEGKADAKRHFHTGLKFLRFVDVKHEKMLFDYIRLLEEQVAGT